MIDTYGLADKDNDQTLYKSLDELDELWETIADEVENIQIPNLKDEARTWMLERKERMEFANFHQFQKLVWEGKHKYSMSD